MKEGYPPLPLVAALPPYRLPAWLVVVSACVRGMGEGGKGNGGVGGPAYRRADVVRVSTHATQTYDVRQIDRLRQYSSGKETGHIALA